MRIVRGGPAELHSRLVGLLLGTLVGLLLVELGLGDPIFSVQLTSVVTATAVVGIALDWQGPRRGFHYFALSLLFFFALVCGTPFTRLVTVSWPRNDSLRPASQAPLAPQAIVVLSSTIRANGALDRDALNRLLTGLELIHRYPSARLVTSRVWERYRGVRMNSDVDQRRLIELAGVTGPWDIVPGTHSTHDEALGAAKLLLPNGVRNIVVVTAPMHTRRACATFEQVGFAVTCRAALEHELVTWKPVTERDRLAAFKDYEYELLAMIEYRARGWLPASQ